MPRLTQAGYTPPEIKEPPKKIEEKKPPKKKKKRKPDRKPMSGAAKFSIVVLLLAVVIGAATVGVFLGAQPYADTYAPGLLLADFPIGGLSRENAQTLLHQLTDEAVSGWEIGVTWDKMEWSISAEDVGLYVDEAATLEPLWAIGHTGSLAQDFLQIARSRAQTTNAQPVFVYDEAPVLALAKRIAADINREPVDATVRYVPGNAEPFRFTKEETGYAVDEQALAGQMLSMLREQRSGDIALSPRVIEPKAYRAELQNAIVLRGRVIQPLSGDEGADNNAMLAAGYLNGLQIAPGETLSFNDTVGERTKEAGYALAIEEAYGADVSGVGGGVCQTATALYRAALLSDLPVAERHAASRPVSYCEAGLEAAVSGQGLDLVIENTTDSPIFVMTRGYKLSGARVLEIQFIGEPLGAQVELLCTSTETAAPTEPVYVRDSEGRYATYEDERVPVGDGLPGISAQVVRVFSAKGEEISRDTISEDVYEAQPPAIYVGIQKR